MAQAPEGLEVSPDVFTVTEQEAGAEAERQARLSRDLAAIVGQANFGGRVTLDLTPYSQRSPSPFDVYADPYLAAFRRAA